MKEILSKNEGRTRVRFVDALNKMWTIQFGVFIQVIDEKPLTLYLTYSNRINNKQDLDKYEYVITYPVIRKGVELMFQILSSSLKQIIKYFSLF
jgi:hypothetical protein